MKGQRAVNTPPASRSNALPSTCRRIFWAVVTVVTLGACQADHTPADLAHKYTANVTSIENTHLNEASGLAVSRRSPGRLWLHNDSGDTARLFATNAMGRGLHSVRVEGAQHIDWEDLAAYVLDGEPKLLIADVGDNRAVRPSVQLYVLDEPAADANSATASTLTVTYPDGPRDVEAVAVDAMDRRVYLLSKRDAPPRLYQVGLATDTDSPVEAELLGAVTSLPPPTDADLQADPKFGQFRSQPTAMSVSADGSRIVITTYKDSYLYLRSNDEPWIDTLNRTPVVIDVPQFRQTEAGGISADGRTLFIASEQLPAPLVRIELP